MNTELINAAGIVIYFDNTLRLDKTNDNEILYLCLIDKKKGEYDFPKGCIDSFDEDAISCAIRETKEETSLEVSIDYVIDSNEYHILSDKLAMFSARYIDLLSSLRNFCINKSEKIKIIKNPETGHVEHSGFVWLSYEKAKKNMLPYLQETLEYYNSKIKKQYTK